MTLQERLWQEYPVPEKLSVWGPNVQEEIKHNLDKLCESVLDDLCSDLFVYESMRATGIQTQMPEDCVIVTSAKLEVGFQGNRYVKHTYDRHTKVCFLRYIPAIITYKRHVRLEDFGTQVKGARLDYFKAAVLEKMARTEIFENTAVKLETDAGSIDLEVLQKFKDEKHDLVNELKQDITLYAHG